jgi:hypothetical protein
LEKSAVKGDFMVILHWHFTETRGYLRNVFVVESCSTSVGKIH